MLSDLDIPYAIIITGVGGIGMATLAAILGIAVHIESKGVNVLDMRGFSQKFGAVTSHMQTANHCSDTHATRIAAGHPSLLLACDTITASSTDVLSSLNEAFLTHLSMRKARSNQNLFKILMRPHR